jgi:predicted glutamine amidotransferase
LLRPTSRAACFAASSKRDEASAFPRDDDHDICRWLAYSGSPVLVEELLYNRKNSLIVQSLHSRLGAEETNGDGFGLGWYGDQDTPGVFRSIEPAWNDRNLRELSRQLSSGLVFAHIRASTGSPVQQTNCHPFRHGRWLFMHNGFLDGFHDTKRDLVLAVDPALYPEIEGTTDTELMFYLALTFGLEDDPPQAVARMVGFVESTGHAHGVEFPFQGTIATTDGERIWAFRYSSEGDSRSLYFSTRLDNLKALHPELAELEALSDETRVIVSEPLGDLPGAWNEVPESHVGIVQPGEDELRPFSPSLP